MSVCKDEDFGQEGRRTRCVCASMAQRFSAREPTITIWRARKAAIILALCISWRFTPWPMLAPADAISSQRLGPGSVTALQSIGSGGGCQLNSGE